MRLTRPVTHVTGLRRLGVDAQKVAPVKLLVIGLNKRLAVTLKISWTLRVKILHVEGELKELLSVTLYTGDDLIWHSMIYQLPIISWTNSHDANLAVQVSKKF
jgi:hypothetical protein